MPSRVALTDDDYQLLPPDDEGIIRSQVFPGLWLTIEPLLNQRMAQVLAVVHMGINSPDHQAFVEQLSAQ